MAIDFKKVNNTWVAKKDGVTLTVIDADNGAGDGKIENHDGFKVTGGSISVFGKPSEISAAIARLVPSGYTSTAMDYYKTDEKGNHKFADVAVAQGAKGKQLNIKQGTEYNIGSLFTVSAAQKSTTTTPSASNSTSTSSTSFTPSFDPSSIMSGMGGFGGFGGFSAGSEGISGLNPASFGLMGGNAGLMSGLFGAYNLAGTIGGNPIMSSLMGAALPLFTCKLADGFTSSALNNMTSGSFIEKYSNNKDFLTLGKDYKPSTAAGNDSTKAKSDTTSTVTSGEATWGDENTDGATASTGSRTGAGRAAKGPKVTTNYENKGATRYDYKDGSAKIVSADGTIKRLFTNDKGERYCDFYDKNDKYISTTTYHADGTKTAKYTSPTARTSADKKPGVAAKNQAKIQEEAESICSEIYAATKGCGTNNSKLKKATDRITKDNVMQVMKTWSESSYAVDMDETSLIKLVGEETDGGNQLYQKKSQTYLAPIENSLAELAKEKPTKQLKTVIDTNYDRILKWNDEKSIDMIQTLYEKVKAGK